MKKKVTIISGINNWIYLILPSVLSILIAKNLKNTDVFLNVGQGLLVLIISFIWLRWESSK